MKCIIGLILICFLSACAVFPGYKIGKQPNPTPIDNPKRDLNIAIYSIHTETLRPIIFDYVEILNTKSTMQLGGLSGQQKMKWFIEAIRDEFESHHLFKSVNLIPGGQVGESDLAMEVIFPSKSEDVVSSTANMFWQVASGVTLGIIPYWKKMDSEMIIKVSSRGKLMKTYTINDDFTFVFSLLVLPLTPFYLPDKEIRNLQRNMLKKVAAQLKADSIAW